MAQLVVNATALVNYFSCLVGLIHHVPLADDERLRGWTGFPAALDVSIFSKREKGSLVATLTVKKLKDDDDGQSFTVHLVRVVCLSGQTRIVFITGALHRDPVSRIGKTGAPFVTAQMRWPDGTESGWASIIAFAEDARAELLRLHEDDVVTVQGEARIATYTAKDGTARPSLEITAAHVLALRQPKQPKTSAPARHEMTHDDRRDAESAILGEAGDRVEEAICDAYSALDAAGVDRERQEFLMCNLLAKFLSIIEHGHSLYEDYKPAGWHEPLPGVT